MPDGNVPVVLTADRSLMAAYPLLLDGMAAAGQTTAWPSRMVWPLIAPAVRSDGVRARQAPLGLRRIEAALLRAGFSREDVAVVPPERIGRAIGPRTRFVGLSSGDPLGLGMNSTTMSGIFGGRPVTSALFQRLVADVRRRLDAAGASARVVLGGPGVWQAREDDAASRRLGVDHIVAGYCEGNIAELVRDLLDGRDLPFVLEGQGAGAPGDIPRVGGPTVMGMVELSRGCGWGCRFCTLSDQPMMHLPPETILADAETNLAAGIENLSLTSEDAFRYGAGPGKRADPGAFIALLERLGSQAGARTLSIDHANAATLSQFTDAQLREVRRLLSAGRPGYRVWVNLGVETACGELLAASVGRAKFGSAAPDDWGDLCLDQVRRLCRNGFLPMVSLVIGLPGEEPSHAERTFEWVGRLEGEPVAVVPVLLTSVRPGGGARLAAANLTAAQWRLFRRSMAMTLKWLTRLYWQHHSAAGVSLSRRLLVQMLGRGYAVQWKTLLWHRERTART